VGVAENLESIARCEPARAYVQSLFGSSFQGQEVIIGKPFELDDLIVDFFRGAGPAERLCGSE
jgi:hypothetical protein